MTKRTLVTLFFLLAIALLSACQQQAPTGDDSLPGSALQGTTWTLVSMGEAAPLPGAEITAGFMDGQMSGSTGCNNYFYEYVTSGQTIELGGGGVTEIFCLTPEGVMEQEQRYLARLNQVRRFQLTEAELRLFTREGATLRFRPRP